LLEISAIWKIPAIIQPGHAVALRAQNISHFWERTKPARLVSTANSREHFVDLALNLNVLAVCAVFAFVGAVLLGAF
jgi:hypothetical protein